MRRANGAVSPVRGLALSVGYVRRHVRGARITGGWMPQRASSTTQPRGARVQGRRGVRCATCWRPACSPDDAATMPTSRREAWLRRPAVRACHAEGYGQLVVRTSGAGAEEFQPYSFMPLTAIPGRRRLASRRTSSARASLSTNVLKKASPDRIKELLRDHGFSGGAVRQPGRPVVVSTGLEVQDYALDAEGKPVPIDLQASRERTT